MCEGGGGDNTLIVIQPILKLTSIFNSSCYLNKTCEKSRFNGWTWVSTITAEHIDCIILNIRKTLRKLSSTFFVHKIMFFLCFQVFFDVVLMFLRLIYISTSFTQSFGWILLVEKMNCKNWDISSLENFPKQENWGAPLFLIKASNISHLSSWV